MLGAAIEETKQFGAPFY